jgi:branched-chain amino acid transport system ATP-binding protein
MTTSTLPPTLLLSHLSLQISGIQIVDDVSLEVGAGELIGVIGPNGAGKTSLLNLISGTARVSSGSITLRDKTVTGWSAHRRARYGLGRTFQTSYLLLGLTVLENVRLMAQARTARGFGLLRTVGPGDATIARAMEALDRVGLASEASTLAGALSHGDRRKVELAIVLTADAKVILLDEPMAGVNVEDIDGLVELIRAIQTETGATVIMVEHHMHVVLGLAHRVAVMHHGALLACDVPDKVMTNETVQSAYLGEPI